MMSGSPGRDAQLQQQLQQQMLPGELHHQFQPPPSTSSSSPWQALSELTELPPEEIDDGSSVPLPAPPPPHPVVMATPFQQLVGSFGPGGSVPAGETDDDTVVSLDEPLHREGFDLHKPIHQTRSARALFEAQHLNAPV